MILHCFDWSYSINTTFFLVLRLWSWDCELLMCSYFEISLNDYIFSSSLQDRLKKETSFFVVYWIWYANGKNIYQKKITVRYEALLGGGRYAPCLNFKTGHFCIIRRRLCPWWYFTVIVFMIVLVADAVSAYLCVICHHFICLMSTGPQVCQ